MAFNIELPWIRKGMRTKGNPPSNPTQTPPEGPSNSLLYKVFENTVYNKARIDALENNSSLVDHADSTLRDGSPEGYHLTSAQSVDLTSTTQESQNSRISSFEERAGTLAPSVDALSTGSSDLINLKDEQLSLVNSQDTFSSSNYNRILSLSTGLKYGDPSTPIWMGETTVYSKDLFGLPGGEVTPLFSFPSPPANFYLFLRASVKHSGNIYAYTDGEGGWAALQYITSNMVEGVGSYHGFYIRRTEFHELSPDKINYNPMSVDNKSDFFVYSAFNSTSNVYTLYFSAPSSDYWNTYTSPSGEYPGPPYFGLIEQGSSLEVCGAYFTQDGLSYRAVPIAMTEE